MANHSSILVQTTGRERQKGEEETSEGCLWLDRAVSLLRGRRLGLARLGPCFATSCCWHDACFSVSSVALVLRCAAHDASWKYIGIIPLLRRGITSLGIVMSDGAQPTVLFCARSMCFVSCSGLRHWLSVSVDSVQGWMEGFERWLSKVFMEVSETRSSAMLVFVNSGASVSGSEVGSLVCKVLMLCVITLTLKVGGWVGSDHSLLFSVPVLARVSV